MVLLVLLRMIFFVSRCNFKMQFQGDTVPFSISFFALLKILTPRNRKTSWTEEVKWFRKNAHNRKSTTNQQIHQQKLSSKRDERLWSKDYMFQEINLKTFTERTIIKLLSWIFKTVWHIPVNVGAYHKKG